METSPPVWIDARDASLEPLRGMEIVVLGYGNQGRAQALNLRDAGAGVRVRVWARPGGPSARRAAADGFALLATEDLARGDLHACLLPDEIQPEFLETILTPALAASKRPGRIAFAHGFALQFTAAGECLRRPPWEEVFVVAPSGPGSEVRAAHRRGWGVPAFLAVWHDPRGQARARAIAFAHALGATRPGVLETTVHDEAIVDLFGEQAVLCGGLAALLRTAYETLTAAGYAPEMAYLECVHQLRLTADLVHRHGIDGMRARISRTALYGDLTRGARAIGKGVATGMQGVLQEVENGVFAAEWMNEHHAGAPRLAAWRAHARDDSLNRVAEAIHERVFREPLDERLGERAGEGPGESR